MTMMTAATANNPRFAERMHKSLLSLTEPYQIKRQMAYMSDEDLAAMPEEVARSWQRILQGESQPQQTGQIPQQTGQIPISQAAPAATPTSAARSSGLEDGLYRFDPEVGLDNVSRFGHNVWEGVKGTAEGAYQLATSPIETAKGVADLASSAWAYADEDTRDSPEAAPARQIISGLKETGAKIVDDPSEALQIAFRHPVDVGLAFTPATAFAATKLGAKIPSLTGAAQTVARGTKGALEATQPYTVAAKGLGATKDVTVKVFDVLASQFASRLSGEKVSKLKSAVAMGKEGGGPTIRQYQREGKDIPVIGSVDTTQPPGLTGTLDLPEVKIDNQRKEILKKLEEVYEVEYKKAANELELEKVSAPRGVQSGVGVPPTKATPDFTATKMTEEEFFDLDVPDKTKKIIDLRKPDDIAAENIEDVLKKDFDKDGPVGTKYTSSRDMRLYQDASPADKENLLKLLDEEKRRRGVGETPPEQPITGIPGQGKTAQWDDFTPEVQPSPLSGARLGDIDVDAGEVSAAQKAVAAREALPPRERMAQWNDFMEDMRGILLQKSDASVSEKVRHLTKYLSDDYRLERLRIHEAEKYTDLKLMPMVMGFESGVHTSKNLVGAALALGTARKFAKGILAGLTVTGGAAAAASGALGPAGIATMVGMLGMLAFTSPKNVISMASRLGAAKNTLKPLESLVESMSKHPGMMAMANSGASLATVLASQGINIEELLQEALQSNATTNRGSSSWAQ